jgi:nucleoid-associated protein YgaU
MFARVMVIIAAAIVVWAAVAHGTHASAPESTYVVRPHDTLWSIAERRYGGDAREAVWRIERRNRLTGATIRSGQRLVLPG